MASMEVESPGDRLASLYPYVNEKETPLPRQWSSKDKYTYIGLSQNYLRVHYNGSGKNQKDAAAVRANHSVPCGCGIYYYEIKVISKGRDGYIAVGLSAGAANLNKLPGWDKSSYGYHADDGCVFNSRGEGQQYGPTYTTDDVVGCGYNMVESCIFFTKNGVRLGTAVSDVPSNIQLYPSVGLQTPGEVVEANFGESPFVFDIYAMLAEMRHKIHQSIEQHPVSLGEGVWQSDLHKLVLGYLVHHGYTATAKTFARDTNLELGESEQSMRNRQRIQSLMLQGQISHAVSLLDRLHPGLLESNRELKFRVLLRQFVEMISGYDTIDAARVRREEEGDVRESPMEVEHHLDNGEVEQINPEPINFETNQGAVEKLLTFGRELQTLFTHLTQDRPNNQLQTLLHDSFSLLAYTDPHTSPVSYLLDPSQREPVAAALNSAILKAGGLPGQPPLEFALGHASQCLALMTQNGQGSAAYASIQDLLKAKQHHPL